MKRTISLLFPSFLGMFFLLSGTIEDAPAIDHNVYQHYIDADSVIIKYTGRIKTIIDEKCYDCHSEKGDDEDAKKDLLWDELPKLDKTDQVYALDAIVESVEKGDMPPPKHVRWNPSKKLTQEEAKLLMDWANDLADKLYDE